MRDSRTPLRPSRAVLFFLAPLTFLTIACGGVVNVTSSSCSGAPGAPVTFDVTFDAEALNPTTNGEGMVSIDVPTGWSLTSATYDLNGVPSGAPAQPASDPICADVPQGPVRPGYQRLYFYVAIPVVPAGPYDAVLHTTFDTGTTPPGVYYPQFYGATRDASNPPGTCAFPVFPPLYERYVIGSETDVPFSVSSIFNADVIVNEVGGTIDPTQQSVGDPISDNNAFPTQSVATLLNPASPDGLPDDGVFPPFAGFCTPGAQLEYSNADNGNNSRRSENVVDTFTFPVPQNAYDEIHLYGTYSGSAQAAVVEVTLNYSDSTSTVANPTFPVWAVPPGPFAIASGLSYPLIANRDALEPVDVGGDGFLYQDANNRVIWAAPVDADQTRQLTSVTVTRLDAIGVFNFFGATGVLIDVADVSIAKARTSGGALTVGTNATYTLTLGNSGPTDALGVVVQDVLPPQLQFVSATASQGACTQAAGTVACNIGTVAVGGTPTVTIVAQPTTTGSITNTATITTTSSETDTADNSSTLTETAGAAPTADLTITKVPQGATTVATGTNVTYLVTATNGGPAGATNVIVTDAVPANTTFQSATPSQGTCSLVATTVTCNVGSLASGASATITMVFRANTAGTIANTATITADQSDPVLANNTATAPGVTVVAAAQIPLLSMNMLFALAAALAIAAAYRLSI